MNPHSSQDPVSHTATKNFACTAIGCTKRFYRKEHLTRHLKSHDPNLQYGCHICGRRYARSDVLKRHIEFHPRSLQPLSADGTTSQANGDTDDPMSRAINHDDDIDNTVFTVIAEGSFVFPEFSGLQPANLLNPSQQPTGLHLGNIPRHLTNSPLSATSNPSIEMPTRIAVRKAAQFARMASLDIANTKSTTGSLLNPLAIPGLLMGAIVVISYAFRTCACPLCTDGEPVDIFQIFDVEDDDERFMRWREKGVGLANWGNNIFVPMPLCQCNLAALVTWFRELLIQDKNSEKEFAEFLKELVATT